MPRYAFGDPALSSAFDRPAVTVGVFDGVHRGHRRLLEALVGWAEESGVEPVVVTFDQHPREVLGQESPRLLTSLDHRAVLLERAGVRGVVVLPFDQEVASWPPEEFVRRVFVDTLGASRVLVGQNHRFGKDRRGDFPLLTRLGERHGFAAREVELATDGHVISSTAIRAAIQEGHLERAAELLGRPVSVLGAVVEGDRRGRTIGFPTANLDLGHACRPPRGVYAARARTVTLTPELREGPLHPAVVNIGRRPTFHPEADEDLVEAHLLEGGQDLYGRDLEVIFASKLRDERRFDGPDALKAQIAADVAQARELLHS